MAFSSKQNSLCKKSSSPLLFLLNICKHSCCISYKCLNHTFGILAGIGELLTNIPMTKCTSKHQMVALVHLRISPLPMKESVCPRVQLGGLKCGECDVLSTYTFGCPCVGPPVP